MPGTGHIDNGCSELVERCRYVTGGMEFDLTPLPSMYMLYKKNFMRSTYKRSIFPRIQQWFGWHSVAHVKMCTCK